MVEGFDKYVEDSVNTLMDFPKEQILIELFSHLTPPEKTIILEILLYRYHSYLFNNYLKL